MNSECGPALRWRRPWQFRFLALEANTGVGAMGGLAYLTLEPAPN